MCPENDTCPIAEYFGKKCLCISCNHVDGICIDHESGSGCAECDGPVIECAYREYMEFTEIVDHFIKDNYENS